MGVHQLMRAMREEETCMMREARLSTWMGVQQSLWAPLYSNGSLSTRMGGILRR